jgi:hypothetical protein
MPSAIPRPLRWTQLLLVVLALLQIVTTLMFLSHRPEVAASWTRRQPNLLPEQIEQAADQTIIGSVIFHAGVAALLSWLALILPSGKRWVRLLTTATLVVGAVAAYGFLRNSSALIPEEVTGVTIEQLLSLVLRLAALWLLWVPREVRNFFSAEARAA